MLEPKTPGRYSNLPIANDGKGWQRRNMAWARLDDGFGDHPKVLDVIETLDEMVGAAAIGLWSLGLAYAHRTMRTAKIPGFIPRSFARTARVPASLGDKLCDAGLWERAEGGWVVHDFDDYLPSAELKAKRAEAGRRGAQARWGSNAAGQEAGADEPAGGDSNLPSDANGKNGNACPEPEPEPNKKKTSSSSTPRKRGTRIPDDFTVTAEMVDWCRRECPGVDGQRETQKFINYWTARTGSGATKLDWAATWRNWMLSAAERASPPRANGTNGYQPYQGQTDPNAYSGGLR